MDWSPVTAGRLATGDCKKHIYVWEPQEGGKWQVSAAYSGHSGSVEDIQWSPTEATVFTSCSVDEHICVWDVRERGRPMIKVKVSEGRWGLVSLDETVVLSLWHGCCYEVDRCLVLQQAANDMRTASLVIPQLRLIIIRLILRSSLVQ